MGISTILMFVVMIGLIFVMQRQQKKQANERQNQLNAITKGDQVVTIGGMYAFVDDVDKEANRVVLDVDGIFLPFELSAIKRVVSKGEAVTETVASTEEVVTVDETNLPVVEDTDIAVQEETAISESK
ncbi:preprotein translocase subunit YajC [Streptococcus hongkongensis]|nr:preprotein translocase [Streptococcus uberis]